MPVSKSEPGGVFQLETVADADVAFQVKSLASNTVNLKISGAGLLGVGGTAPPTSRVTFTQTYATSDATVAAYTPDAEGSAYSGGSTDANLALNADLNALRAAYENLRAHSEDVGKALNSVIDALQYQGIVA